MLIRLLLDVGEAGFDFGFLPLFVVQLLVEGIGLSEQLFNVRVEFVDVRFLLGLQADELVGFGLEVLETGIGFRSFGLFFEDLGFRSIGFLDEVLNSDFELLHDGFRVVVSL